MAGVNIAAVQFKWKMEDYKSRETLQDRVDGILKDIRSKIDNTLPLLVVFPEDIGTPILLFGSYDQIKDTGNFAQAAQALIMANLPGVLKYKFKYGVSFIRSLILSKAAYMEDEYIKIFSSSSKKYNAYIAAGSITLPDFKVKGSRKKVSNRNVYNISFFFGPDGSIIGKQKKVHLVDFEGKSGFDLCGGELEDLKVFETPFGKVGIAICLDAFKEDVCDTLSLMGADILLQPSANNGQWSKWQQEDWLNGSYLAVNGRRKFKYAINPMMNGSILDLAFEGQSSIISSEDGLYRKNYLQLESADGFISIAKDYNQEEILLSTVKM